MTTLPRGPRMTVAVTQERISEAVRGDSSHCMIAESIKSSIPHAQRISVDLQTIRFTNPRTGVRYVYLTPRIAQLALIQFDQGIEMAPFKFSLRGAQVTWSGQTKAKPHEKKTENVERGKKAIRASTKSVKEANKRAKAVLRNNTDYPGAPPTKVGGKTPPMDIPFSRRRSFGLRLLKP